MPSRWTQNDSDRLPESDDSDRLTMSDSLCRHAAAHSDRIDSMDPDRYFLSQNPFPTESLQQHCTKNEHTRQQREEERLQEESERQERRKRDSGSWACSTRMVLEVTRTKDRRRRPPRLPPRKKTPPLL